MKNLTVFVLLFFPFIIRAQPADNKDIAAIRRVLADQEMAWNKGDIDAFMTGYWHTDSLKFVGARGITKGWQNTSDGYKKRYPNTDAMGILKFTILSIEKTGKKSAFVTGQWQLTRKIGDIGGYFTLLWKKINGKWVIAADHTSVRE